MVLATELDLVPAMVIGNSIEDMPSVLKNILVG